MMTEKDNAEDQGNDFPPVEDDPADVEHRRHGGDENAERDKERDGGGAAGDAHGFQEEDSTRKSEPSPRRSLLLGIKPNRKAERLRGAEATLYLRMLLLACGRYQLEINLIRQMRVPVAAQLGIAYEAQEDDCDSSGKGPG